MTDQTKIDSDETGEDAPLELTTQEPAPRRPAKKRRARGGVTIRLDDATSARVDAYLEQFQRRHLGIHPERREILVHLICRGLDAVEGSLAEMSDAELRALADQHGIEYRSLGLEPGAVRGYLIDALEATL